MTEYSALPGRLRELQNGDGGWGYNVRASSWTEPTALALLALQACGIEGPEFQRGIAWLTSRQRPDGGWTPNDAVATTCSVTTTCMLALGCKADSSAYSAGIAWTLSQLKRAPTSNQMPSSTKVSAEAGGCAWVPGTAAWVAPTVMMVLAFRQAIRLGYEDPEIAAQIAASEKFLLARRCPDGGWNHGGSSFRSPNAESYPEMTGVALLAFEPGDAQISTALRLATQMQADPGSSEAESWLRMALTYHGERTRPHPTYIARTIRDLALQILAVSGSRNPLLV